MSKVDLEGVAKIIYEALAASDDAAFLGELDLQERTTIDGAFDMSNVADIVIARLTLMGVISASQPDKRR